MTPTRTHRTTVRLPEIVGQRFSDRQFAHRCVMRALPDGLGDSPRSAATCLWHYSPRDRHLVIAAASNVRANVLGDLVEARDTQEVRAGDRLRVAVDLACLKTPMSDVSPELRDLVKATGGAYRSRSIPVPENERESWVTKRFAERGVTPESSSIEISELRMASLGRRGGGIPYVEVNLVGIVHDAAAFNDALRRGVGKGKNFGLGLIRSANLSGGSHVVV